MNSKSPMHRFRYERSKTQIMKEELENIKKEAYEIWTRPVTAQTTYSESFSEPKMKREPTKPTLFLSRNNPHPPLIFLTTRLRYIPGYFNSRETAKNCMETSKVITIDKYEQIQNIYECKKKETLKENKIVKTEEIKSSEQESATISRKNTNNQNERFANLNYKKPYRGDFLIHYDWHPKLKHHSLPCLC